MRLDIVISTLLKRKMKRCIVSKSIKLRLKTNQKRKSNELGPIEEENIYPPIFLNIVRSME
jgi:hypothetical protein